MPGWILGVVGAAWMGCSAHEANWLRLYDARAEFEAFRTSPDAELVADETQRAREALHRAELALKKKRYDEVAAISEIVLLRVEKARAVARRRLAEREAAPAEAELDALSKEVEAQRARLEQAKSELAALTSEFSLR